MTTRTVLVLAAIALGACGKVADVPVDPGTQPSTGLQIGGSVESDDARYTRPSEVTRVVVLWDARRNGESFPLKFGEGTIADGRISLDIPTEPPSLALVHGAVGVGNIVAVAKDAEIPDGELTPDQADELLAAALGGANATMVVFKADSSERFPWLAAFADGLSCARSAGEAGFTPSDCTQFSAKMARRTSEGELEFNAWQPPPGGLPRSD